MKSSAYCLSSARVKSLAALVSSARTLTSAPAFLSTFYSSVRALSNLALDGLG